jgi:hypothetical protein
MSKTLKGDAIRVTTSGGKTFIGKTAQTIVRAMKRTQWEAPERKSHYMDEVRERVSQQTGVWISIRTAETFLRGLEAAGLITIERGVLSH